MRDRSKKLLVINTGKKESEQAGMTAQPGVTHIIGGGGMSVNMSDYLLKSIWDKVWEIRTDSAGTDYIFGKLPVVLQYGLTMYSGEGADIPTLASGLPFDGRTIWYNPDTQQIEVIGGTGGGSGEGVSNFWDLSGIPSWITNSKPKYSYSEIEGTPDLSVYAQVDTLKAYVTLAGAQTLTGEKNFTGGLKVNGSPIIYDSVNKYWKLQGNLVLTGGITMYADDGTLNLPSIYDGLPIDGTTIYWDTDAAGNRVIKAVIGGGTADSVAWINITGKPTWIGSSKPVYSYSEIQGTPDLSVYALKTQIPSLSGYATESWVTKQNYATKATTLSGYGITDAYTKTNVDDLLKAYVTLSGEQTISGKKNFTTGGLFVNGRQIKYDATKKYWKLEGDLLVTGGVTMYGSDSSFTPSTIMDAILYDSATLGINSNGQLYVKGGAGGGINTTDLQNYLTQNSYLNVTSGDNRYLKLSGGSMNGVITMPINHQIQWGSSSMMIYGEDANAIKIVAPLGLYVNSKEVWHSGNFTPSNYLPLSGGTLSSNLTIQNKTVDVITLYRDDVNNSPTIKFTNKSDGTLGYIGVLGSGSDIGIQPFFMDSAGAVNKVWHSGNFNPSNYLPLSGGTMTGNILLGGTTTNKIGTNIVDTTGGWQEFTHQNSHGYIAIGPFNDSVAHIYTDRPSFFFNKDLYVNNAKVWNAGNDGSGSGLDADLLDGKQPSELNVASATKLQTARTIWGQSFDGTGNVSGVLTLPLSHQVQWADSGGAMIYAVSSKRIIIDGSVGIGTTSPEAKAHILSSEFNILKVTRNNAFGAGIYFSNSNGELGDIGFHDNKNFVIRNSAHDTDIMVLSQSGNLLVIGGMTMYSQRSLKNVVNERGLSLSELSTIKPTRYTWKDGRDNRLHFGGIADDIQQVLPEVVYSTSDGILTMDYGNAAFAVASSLIKPVVDHEKRIAMLEEENKQLRLEIERLKIA